MQGFNDYQILELLAKDSLGSSFTDCDDCPIRTFEYTNGCDHFYKRLFSVRARKAINSFEDLVDKNIDHEKKFFEFISYLPKGIYQMNMLEVIKD